MGPSLGLGSGLHTTNPEWFKCELRHLHHCMCNVRQVGLYVRVVVGLCS